MQASPAQYPLHDVRVHDEDDDDDTPMPMPITADESNLFQVGNGGQQSALGLCAMGAGEAGATVSTAVGLACMLACLLIVCSCSAPRLRSGAPLQLGSRLPPGQELQMQEALATAAQRQQLESTPEEGGSEAAAAAAAAAAPAAAPAAVGAAAGVAAGGVLGGMLRKLSSKKGAKEAAAAEEAAATAAAAEAAAAAAATQGEAPSNQLTPRPSTDSDAPQQQREGLAMPSPRPRGSMELLPEDMPDVVMVTPAGGGPPVPMVPLSMPENVQASGRVTQPSAH